MTRILSGIDIVEVKRIAKHVEVALEADGFIRKCFTKEEIDYCMSKTGDSRSQSFAARYAAKEAAAKALGTGICAKGIAFTDLETHKENTGAPTLELHGKALELSQQMKVTSISVSLSHEKDYAIANVYMLCEGDLDEEIKQ